jgi:hypothetical protein
MEEFTFAFGLMFFSIYLVGLIIPSICEISGNCLSSINFHLIGGIGLICLIIGSLLKHN